MIAMTLISLTKMITWDRLESKENAPPPNIYIAFTWTMALTAQPPPESHMISIGLLETGQPHCQTRKLKSVPLFIVVKALPNGRLRVKQNTRTKFFFKFFIIKISLNTNVSLSLKFDYSKETRI